MLLGEVAQLLKPGYMPMETGCHRLQNGQMYLAVLTRMPGCKSKWVDWWYRNFCADAIEASISHEPYFNRGEKPDNKNCAGAKHYGKYMAEAKMRNIQFRLDDSSKYFNTAQVVDAGIGAVICASSVFPDGTLSGHVIHIVRDTDYGCEMRSRFWINTCTDEEARIRLEHYIADMGYLADFLRSFIEEIHKLRNKPNVSCKFCYSDKVVKNGTRHNTQYWLCRNCGRGFVNNHALPKMKYSLDTITKAVHDYYANRSISNVRKDIERESNILPSNSTIYGWVKKLSGISA